MPRRRIDNARHADPGPDYAVRGGTRGHLDDVVSKKSGDTLGTWNRSRDRKHPRLD